MVPGVSRSGATIVGAMLLGADKRAAAEFSFFLAMPTMAGAFAYDLLKNYKILSANDVASIVVGFIAAFVSALLVVRSLLDLCLPSRFTHRSPGGESSSERRGSPGCSSTAEPF